MYLDTYLICREPSVRETSSNELNRSFSYIVVSHWNSERILNDVSRRISGPQDHNASSVACEPLTRWHKVRYVCDWCAQRMVDEWQRTKADESWPPCFMIISLRSLFRCTDCWDLIGIDSIILSFVYDASSSSPRLRLHGICTLLHYFLLYKKDPLKGSLPDNLWTIDMTSEKRADRLYNMPRFCYYKRPFSQFDRSVANSSTFVYLLRLKQNT